MEALARASEKLCLMPIGFIDVFFFDEDYNIFLFINFNIYYIMVKKALRMAFLQKTKFANLIET